MDQHQYIYEVFANVPKPDAQTIVVTTNDDEGTYDTFAGKTPREVVRKEISLRPWVSWYLSEDALIYYLPCFLDVILSGDNKDVVCSHVVTQFEDSSSERRADRARRLRERLTVKQREIIYSTVLQVMGERVAKRLRLDL